MTNEVPAPALRKLINPSQPFGPTNAQEISDDALSALFFDADNRIYDVFESNPTIIVGRRGSGKTSYLRSGDFLRQYDIVLDVRTEKLFAKLLHEIEKMVEGAVFVESIADLWDTIFHIALFDRIVNDSRYGAADFRLTKDYLAKIGAKRDKRLDGYLWNIVEVIAKRGKGRTIGVLAEVVKTLDSVTFDDARDEIYEFARRNNVTAIILVDSLDALPIGASNVAHTLSGLLKCVGAFNNADRPFNIRFCLPAELFHVFMDLSANPLKDFGNHVTLQWHAKELLSIAAHRIQLYAEQFETALSQQIKHLRHEDARDAEKTFYSVFPREVTNDLSFREDTLAYIVRHTQLLPRQFLAYLNAIGSRHIKAAGQLAEVSERSVVQGIAACEGGITSEIFSAFRGLYPNAREVCYRCIPELPLQFELGDLQRVYTRFGKKVCGELDFYDFKRMLIEIGAVGRWLRDTDRYMEGYFEYAAPHRLVTSTDDSLCLHPVFAGPFSCRTDKSGGDVRTVYPYGSDLAAEDRRDLTSIKR